ncbi:ABC transporter permease [Priestia koreensis]|uniref:ABC-2 family transporter protein n=1 Tax=Priestia koreensis TaxID=284581 RepID=A0A0M0KWE0_9BACI|nr:ABC transporter permease [Priestia koreensis]KOO42703.1 hypothetical protein AMD01_16280 [Priestia koreensis]
MQLFWMEMKKIFSWKMMILLAFVNVVLYFLLFSFHIEYFPNGRPDRDDFAIEQKFIPKYGANINRKEYGDFVKEYNQKVQQADTYLKNDPQADDAGITSYESLRQWDDNNQKQSNYHDLIFFKRSIDEFWELQAMEGSMEQYKYRVEPIQSEMKYAEKGQKKHFQTILAEKKYPSYTDTVLENFNNVKTNLSIILFISVAIFISPLFLRDRLKELEPLQYSSKKGRRVYRTKLLAGLASTAILTTLLLFVYLSIYATNHTSSHFQLPLHSMSSYYWYDVTFWEYIVWSVLAICFSSLLLGTLSMAISTIVPNTIVLIGVQILTTFVMIAGVAFFLIGDTFSIFHPIWFVPAGYAVFFVLVVGLMIVVGKREARRDVL